MLHVTVCWVDAWPATASAQYHCTLGEDLLSQAYDTIHLHRIPASLPNKITQSNRKHSSFLWLCYRLIQNNRKHSYLFGILVNIYEINRDAL